MKESLSKTTTTAASERENISNIEKEISALNEEIYSAYTQIGRRFVQYVTETKHMPGIDVTDILNMLDPKMSRKAELEAELLEIQKRLKDMALIQEKNKLEYEFLKEKEKLDRALAMDVINKDEYDGKVNQYRKRIDCFDDIKKIEQQYELGIIDFNEKEMKINFILNS